MVDKLRLIWHKKFFDRGLSLTNYFKYVIALFGLSSQDVRSTLVLAVLYAVFCYALGRFWIQKKWQTAEMEVDNRLNPFVNEVRKSLNNGKPLKNHAKENYRYR